MTSQTAQLPAVYRPMRRLLLACAGATVIAMMGVVLIATDLGLTLINTAARGVARAGFDINEVKVSGTVNARRLDIIAEVLNGSTNSMLFADIDDIRERIEANDWVQSATVVRRLPSRIEIHIVERKPVALWQNSGSFAVIDATGKVLSTRDIGRFARLPRIVGANAAAHVPGLLTTLARAPEIARSLDAAVWIGGRRWDLVLRSGERILLPEGALAGDSLARFALLNKQAPLIGRGFARFDLRVTDRLVASPLANGAPAEPAASAVPQSAPSPAQPALTPTPTREIRI